MLAAGIDASMSEPSYAAACRWLSSQLQLRFGWAETCESCLTTAAAHNLLHCAAVGDAAV